MEKSFADLLLKSPNVDSRACRKISCSASEFESYLKSLPMASAFNPFSGYERTIMAFNEGRLLQRY